MTPPKSGQQNNFVFVEVLPRVILESPGGLTGAKPVQTLFREQNVSNLLQYRTLRRLRLDLSPLSVSFATSKQHTRFQSRLYGGLLSQVGSGGDAASPRPRVHRQAEKKSAY